MRVGMEFTALAPFFPLILDPAARPAFEAALAAYLDLPGERARGLLQGWYFHWTVDGELRRLRLVPRFELRRTAGIERIKYLFLGRIDFAHCRRTARFRALAKARSEAEGSKEGIIEEGEDA